MRRIISLMAIAILALPLTFVQAEEPLPDLNDQINALTKQIEALKGQVYPKATEVSIKSVDQAQHLQDISVTIVSKSGFGQGEGSGVLMTRKFPNGESVNFVWTAAHCVDNLRRTKNVIDSKTGTQRTIVEFDDAVVVKSLVENGRSVGKIEFFAEVVRFSSEEDLALLRLRKKNFVDSSVKFYLDEQIPPIGTRLLHVGSLLGQLGSNSMTEGIMSQHGRLINKIVFDQTTVNAFPGSSGGGVYLEDGRMVGMLVRGAGETFNLIVPVRRIQIWAKSAKIEWAVNHDVAMISEEELKKIPVEDNGVEFSYSKKEGAAPDAPQDPEHPDSGYRLIGSGRPYLGSEKEEMAHPTRSIFRFSNNP